MNNPHEALLPRLLTPVVEETLRQFPVVVVAGARQTGKSTLVQNLPSAAARSYSTLDDLDTLARAEKFPEALLEQAEFITLDEVQRAPDILLAIKRAVDKNRGKGRFLLTGSANLLLLRRISESLAGRAIYLTLLPMSEREKRGVPDPGLWPKFIKARTIRELAGRLRGDESYAHNWAESVLIGGYPPVVLAASTREGARWFEGYVQTYLERDLRDVASISSLVDFRRLMGLAALRLGQIVNQTELGRDAALSQTTVHRYLNLLEVSYQIVRVPAFARSRSTRLIKSPKLYWNDTGLVAFLSGVCSSEDMQNHRNAGALLENLVLTQLLVWREIEFPRPQIYYCRTASGIEVDFVVESRHGLLPVEVKTSPRARIEDTRSLEWFLDEHPKEARIGLLLYGGKEVVPLTKRVLAVPVGAVL
ncbi:MAG: ATP-binding protein [Deltaproteobacteria bacterium]|nr:ATP-binding protein [Deltaproteobacteria bacterium]